MREYLAKNSKDIKNYPKTLEILKSKEVNLAPIVDSSRYRIRMYFSSSCPHCKRMFKTLDNLQRKGIYVEALQIDDARFKPEYPLPTQKASKEEIKKHNIKSVPFTLIADLKKKALYPPIRGFQDSNQILKLIKEANNL